LRCSTGYASKDYNKSIDCKKLQDLKFGVDMYDVIVLLHIHSVLANDR
jgi:hypothetical protein